MVTLLRDTLLPYVVEWQVCHRTSTTPKYLSKGPRYRRILTVLPYGAFRVEKMQTILCVDDHRETLLTLSLIFRGAGYCCITASNFEEAERAFAADHIDLVVLDHVLPGISGTELATHLRKIRAVAILMLSGSTELVVVPKSVDLLLPKPQAPEELLKAVAVLLAGG